MPIGISKSRWQEIQLVLDEVIDIPESERLEYLDKFRHDEALYQDLKELVCNDLDKLNILDTPAADLLQVEPLLQEFDKLSVSSSDLEQPVQPTQQDANKNFPEIEKYEVEKEIGRGGMGRVYLATQISDSFERRVAIKVLSNTNRDPQIIQRFEKEQRLLASLEHRNIAQLYDGGFTKEGTPYFVMEYVEGESIDLYCDNNKLTIDRRLSLLKQVIDALDFAHKNLIVHRDIKPSNILVTENGAVKLVDFGIAKLVDEEKDNQLTQTGNQILTPGFAAPEQLLDLPITTTTDIYLLGLVLYKLLTGHQAYQDMSGSLVEMVKVMSEEPPTTPSLVNTSLKTPEDSSLLSVRGVSLGQLKSKLSGDLDAIVLKCLSNNSQERYASMSALKSDIECYFNNKPISAQQATFIYQSKKYARRHWKGLGVITSAILILISYAYTVTVQSKKIQSALELSQIEQSKAQQVSHFMLDIFKSADPNVSSLNKMTAAELLDQGRQKVLTGLEQAPEVQSHMLTSLGEVYIELGEIDRSIELLEKSLLIQREMAQPAFTTLANTLTTLGVAYVNGRKLDQAEALFKESIGIHEELISEEINGISIEYAETHTAYGQLQRKLGRYEASMTLYEKSIQLLKQIGAHEHQEMAVALNGLASVQQDVGQFEAAAEAMKVAIKIHERTLGSNHSYFTIYLNNLSILLTSMERYDEAFVYSKRALEIQQTILPEFHRYFAAPLRSLGKISHGRGELKQAFQYFSQALGVYRKKTKSNNYV
ncbi:MAG: protein kinase, partial [Kangiellaceae bacterium]|nr:protein kinase [Kangiellaceae bacterium]